MDNITRMMRYGGVTVADVLARIKAGTENEKLSPGQRRRKLRKRGGTRRSQSANTGVAEPAPEPGLVPERQVFMVFGQRWEAP